MNSYITNQKMASSLTPRNNILRQQDVIVSQISKVRTNSSIAYFKLGMVNLCQNKVEIAEFFLKTAAKNGHKRAREYLFLLNNSISNNVSNPKCKDSKTLISSWRKAVIDYEAKLIAFGDIDGKQSVGGK